MRMICLDNAFRPYSLDF